ncbi:tRNA lysidine(34) synthetase TilS [Maritimibacter sp. 55A14]|uniref:tRNA lysidine(34) synthetase TilS n=1 Tax=Maritimibacter sp. 55A14 TaxID=2174844 RepID=UPI000D612DDA|nr:tRNA lysidine(34) synthetase TilS [Maritimibacter sp. 55A14]PWE29422.1 tRNA lysidine(34) synthetase TilS [Maritimibacter sp. 55A14]
MIQACLDGLPPGRLGVAVSGGGDSVALLALMADWAVQAGVALEAVSVDHGLRPAAAEEAALAGRVAAQLGVPHTVLRWQGWDGSGNLQDAARRGRRGLIAGWARDRGIPAVALGHTQDDQAETLLMRLARGSGVDGLAAMAPRRRAQGIVWLRPLLDVPRAELRDELRARGLPWADDPSNEDTRFDRVKARRMLEALAPLGIERAGLAATARRMARARAALEAQTVAAAQYLAQATGWGTVRLEREGLARQPEEIALRLLAHGLCWVARAPYRPRLVALERLFADALAGRGGTLHGCTVTVARGDIRIMREVAALAQITAPVGALWDGRWRVEGPEGTGLHVAALGERGLEGCANWRDTGIPRAALMATPAVWRGTALVAAPVAGERSDWTARLDPGPDSFHSAILSH